MFADNSTLSMGPGGEVFLHTFSYDPTTCLIVVGHTDRVGSVADNDRLALRRAEKVRARLSAQGFSPGSISASGRGEREPLVATADEVAEVRNRRVEILVR